MNVMTRRGSLDNVVTFQHVCDTRADLANIPLQQISLGSTAIVLHGDKDEFQVYIAKSNKEWILISAGSGGSITPGGGGSGEGGIDTSSDTVTASSLLQGVTAHDATGQQIIGEIITRTISDLQKVDSTITIPAGYYATPISYSTAGVPDNDVVFIDYDGTRVYSYTADEFLALTEMPANPDHTAEGLTAQGWNWDLADAKEYVTNAREIVIGQMYITTDEKTKIQVNIDQYHKDITLNFIPRDYSENIVSLNQDYITVQWGDGTSNQYAIELNEVPDIFHTYSSIGTYIITIDNPYIIIEISGDTSRSNLFQSSAYGTTGTIYSYNRIVEKIYLGKNIRIGVSAFGYMNNLATITIPNTLNTDGIITNGYWFNHCMTLKAIIVPKCFTSATIQQYAATGPLCELNDVLLYISLPKITAPVDFMLNSSLSQINKRNAMYSTLLDHYSTGCLNIKRAYIPSTVETIDYPSFTNSGIESLTIPSSVTLLKHGALALMSNLYELHFTSAQPPTAASSYTFGDLPKFCKIYIPTGTFLDYTTATNYPSPDEYEYEEE